MSAKPLNGDSRRRGVALIVVLGFLSIMVMMAVAFLTQARVERMVANASLEGMRTRQMAQTALAAAMQDYLNALKQVTLVDTTHDIFLSGDGNGTLSYYFSGETIGNNRLLQGKVKDWLLTGQLEAATNGTDSTDFVRNAEWIWVRERPGQRSRILGRYAYACFDLSGLLDANLLGTAYAGEIPEYGDATNRNNVRKMLYEALDQNVGGDGQRKLSFHQDRWKGFDTPAALLSLTDGQWNDGRNVGPNRWIGTDMDEGAYVAVDNLSAYSYSVLHRADGSGNEKKMCTSEAIQGDSDFSQILAGANESDVVKAIADYEDEDSLPQGDPNYPSAEAVPMFNEFGVMAELRETPGLTGTNGLAASTYNLLLHVKIEFWYPFPSEDNNKGETFSMELPTVGGSRQATGNKDIWVQMAGSAGGALFELIAGAATSDPAGPLVVEGKFNDNSPYYANNVNGDNELLYTIPLTRPNGDALLPSGMQLTVRNVQFSQPLILLSSGTPADSTASDKALDFPFDTGSPLPHAGQSPWVSTEVDDPRLNHLFNSWMVPGSSSESFGDINQAAKDAAASVSGIVPGNYLYCRNAPIQRPGELGYLSNGTPWETLDVFSEAGIRLMNRLVCEQEVYDLLQANSAYFTNGTINPYTRHTNVLNAAFYGLDIREVPGISGDPEDDERLNGDSLKDLVPEIMAAETKNGYAGWSAVLANPSLLGDMNKNHRIAALNNTWGLFNESDRLFVVVAIAQSIKEGEREAGLGNWDSGEDVITGERRAVALCWMDASAEGSADTLAQEMNVIMFQYLNE